MALDNIPEPVVALKGAFLEVKVTARVVQQAIVREGEGAYLCWVHPWGEGGGGMRGGGGGGRSFVGVF